MQSFVDLSVNFFREHFLSAFSANRNLKLGYHKRMDVTILADVCRVLDGRDDYRVFATMPASPRKGAVRIARLFRSRRFVRENGHLPRVSKIHVKEFQPRG